MKIKVLVVEDESTLCHNIERYLQRAGHTVIAVETGAAAREALDQQVFDVLLTDLRLPDADGLELVDEARARHPELVCLIMTAYGSMESAVAALRRGVHDFIVKPVSLADVAARVERVSESLRLSAENAHLRELVRGEGSALEILRRGPAMQEICTRIEKTAASSCNVLIVGETGTGKELVARAIHECSRRASGPFLPLALAEVPASSVESYLFGHQAGAVGGAREERRGLFRSASGGTVYLDEVAELDDAAQAKLMRAVEKKEVLPVGADLGVSVDVRVIAATRFDLDRRVEDGAFRRELLLRLRVVEIDVPPLRERLGDLPTLVDALLARHARTLGKAIRGVEPSALALLARYPWPGNVRELSNVLERAVILASTDRLTAADLALGAPRPEGDAAPSEARMPDNLEEAVLQFQRRHIERVLRSVGGNRELAAKSLGLSSATFYRYLQRIGLKGEPS